MARRKVTATYQGQKFTRITERTYTHIILGRVNVESLAAERGNLAADRVRRSWSHYEEVASLKYRNQGMISAEQVQRMQHLVGLGLDAACEFARDEAMAEVRRNYASDV